MGTYYRDPEKINDAMAESFAGVEKQRIERLRRDYGDRVWADQLGRLISTNLIAVGAEGTLNTNNGIAQVILWNLTEQIVNLYLHPEFGKGLAAGVIEELASRHLIDITTLELQCRRRTIR